MATMTYSHEVLRVQVVLHSVGVSDFIDVIGKVAKLLIALLTDGILLTGSLRKVSPCSGVVELMFFGELL